MAFYTEAKIITHDAEYTFRHVDPGSPSRSQPRAGRKSRAPGRARDLFPKSYTSGGLAAALSCWDIRIG